MNKKREYSLDFMKFIATVLIVFHHYQQSYSGNYTIIKYYGGKFYFGHLVELFFIISGYFALNMVSNVTSTGEGESFAQYFGKRIKRLLPIMAIAAVGDQIIRLVYELILKEPLGVGITLWGTFLAAFGLQDGGAFISQGINNPTWYLCCLLICYVVLYILTWLSHKLAVSKQWLYIGMVFLGTSALSYKISYPFLTTHSARAYMAFFMGICLAILMERKKIYEQKKIVTSCIAFVIFFVFLVIYANDVVKNDMRFIVTFLVWPCLLIIFKSPWIAKILSQPVWGVLAGISFNTYIWHAGVLKILCIFRDLNSTDAFYNRGAMLFFTLVCFGIGFLSYFYLEKPIIAYVNDKIQRNKMCIEKNI